MTQRSLFCNRIVQCGCNARSQKIVPGGSRFLRNHGVLEGHDFPAIGRFLGNQGRTLLHIYAVVPKHGSKAAKRLWVGRDNYELISPPSACRNRHCNPPAAITRTVPLEKAQFGIAAPIILRSRIRRRWTCCRFQTLCQRTIFLPDP
jgi:hypothetical protein